MKSIATSVFLLVGVCECLFAGTILDPRGLAVGSVKKAPGRQFYNVYSADGRPVGSINAWCAQPTVYDASNRRVGSIDLRPDQPQIYDRDGHWLGRVDTRGRFPSVYATSSRFLGSGRECTPLETGGGALLLLFGCGGSAGATAGACPSGGTPASHERPSPCPNGFINHDITGCASHPTCKRRMSAPTAPDLPPVRNPRNPFLESDESAPPAPRKKSPPPPSKEVEPVTAEDRLAEILERAHAFEKAGRLIEAVESFRWVERHGRLIGAPEANRAREAIDRIEADPAAMARLEEEAASREIGILLGWARTYQGNGKLEEARRYYERIVLEHPDCPEASEAARAIEEIARSGS